VGRILVSRIGDVGSTVSISEKSPKTNLTETEKALIH